MGAEKVLSFDALPGPRTGDGFKEVQGIVGEASVMFVFKRAVKEFMKTRKC